MQHWKAVAADAPALRIGLVQAEPGYVQTAPRLRELSEQIVDRVDLVCWPESSAGCYATELTSFADKQQIVLQSREPDRGLQPWPDARCALLTGASLYRGNGETPEALYQAAILIDPNQQIVDSYTKRFLMPFGEFMPLEDWFPGLQELFPRDEAISRGSVANPLRFGERARLGVMLCYEDMMPLAARSLCQGSANLLVSLINASDFEATLARSQHRLLAQMRAIECRRYLVRCAATGETCVISPWGTIEERLPLEGEGTLTAKVRLIDRPSVYSQRGEFLPWLCGTALLVYLISVRLVGAGQAKTLRTDG
jgi:apolipoprotein N-acyltransferase